MRSPMENGASEMLLMQKCLYIFPSAKERHWIAPTWCEPPSWLLIPLVTHDIHGPGGEQSLWLHPQSCLSGRQMSRRGIVSLGLSPLSLLSKNCVFCLSIVLKIVHSRRDIGLFRKPLLARTKIFCGSKLFEKASYREPARTAMVAKGTIELLTQRQMMVLQTLFSSPATWKRKRMSQREWWTLLSAC